MSHSHNYNPRNPRRTWSEIFGCFDQMDNLDTILSFESNSYDSEEGESTFASSYTMGKFHPSMKNSVITTSTADSTGQLDRSYARSNMMQESPYSRSSYARPIKEQDSFDSDLSGIFDELELEPTQGSGYSSTPVSITVPRQHASPRDPPQVSRQVPSHHNWQEIFRTPKRKLSQARYKSPTSVIIPTLSSSTASFLSVHEAAILIQALVRGYQVRSCLAEETSSTAAVQVAVEEEAAALIKAQLNRHFTAADLESKSEWRNSVSSTPVPWATSTKDLVTLVRVLNADQVATLIQATYRGHASRSRQQNCGYHL